MTPQGSYKKVQQVFDGMEDNRVQTNVLIWRKKYFCYQQQLSNEETVKNSSEGIYQKTGAKA